MRFVRTNKTNVSFVLIKFKSRLKASDRKLRKHCALMTPMGLHWVTNTSSRLALSSSKGKCSFVNQIIHNENVSQFFVCKPRNPMPLLVYNQTHNRLIKCDEKTLSRKECLTLHPMLKLTLEKQILALKMHQCASI